MQKTGNMPNINTLQALLLLWQEQEGVHARAAHAAARAARAAEAAPKVNAGHKPSPPAPAVTDVKVRENHTCAP
jgi:hypothetical protein